MELYYKNDFIDPLFSVIKTYYIEAQKFDSYIEQVKATKIQSKDLDTYKLRRQSEQNYFIFKAAILIQKVLRGLFARLLLKRKKGQWFNQNNNRYYSHIATTIQRYYKGYIRRKYVHNYYRRKDYLLHLRTQNNRFQKDIKDLEERERKIKQKLELEAAMVEFNRLGQNLHHLTSTKAQSGVYNKPYRVNDRVFGMEVDSHLKRIFHSNYRSVRRSRYQEVEESENSFVEILRLKRFK